MGSERARVIAARPTAPPIFRGNRWASYTGVLGVKFRPSPIVGVGNLHSLVKMWGKSIGPVLKPLPTEAFPVTEKARERVAAESSSAFAKTRHRLGARKNVVA